MELKDFIANFAEQFEETEGSVFSPECRFQELDEWGSLTAMGVIAFVKTEYGKMITGQEIRSCETLQELFEMVSNK